MLKPLEKMIEQAEGAWLDPARLATLKTYHKEFRLRSETYRAIERKEAEIVASVAAGLRRTNARALKQCGPEAEGKCSRDAASVLRQCALAMLLDDREYLYDYFLHWLKTIMVAIDHLPMHRQVYPLLQEAVRAHLKPAQAELINRYIAYAASVMA
jgi:hypothetical protein